jgi:CRISPR-associated protein Cas8a1/Csx13
MEKEDMGDTVTSSIEWSLTDDGMGILERAGLAGIYLSLKAAEEWADQGDGQAIDLQRNLKWKLSQQSVRLEWKGKDLSILKKLVEWAWQVLDGIYYLPGMHRTRDEKEHFWIRLDTHSGLLHTFFQHNRVMPREKSESTLVNLDENDALPITFQRLKGIPCQIKKIRQVLGKGINTNKPITLPSWVYPGAARRFGTLAKGETDWQGIPKFGFILLFAPIGCVYYQLPGTRGKTSQRVLLSNWVFLFPDIRNLETFSSRFQRIREQTPIALLRVKVQGLGDAGLRFASAYVGHEIEKRVDVEKIYAAAMGHVTYYQGQSVRKRTLEITPSWSSIKRYLKLMKHMPNSFRKLAEENAGKDDEKKGSHWIYQPTARGRISENLVKEFPWYLDLMDPPNWQLDKLENQRKMRENPISIEHLWFTNLQREWRELMELVKEDSMWDSPEEKNFVSIFHGALRRLLDREERSLSRGGSRNLFDRWEDRVETIRRELMHAKTLPLTRKFIVEFLAESGGNKDLTENRISIWQFINHPSDWKKVRDLALLALVTFTDGRLGRREDLNQSHNNGGENND